MIILILHFSDGEILFENNTNIKNTTAAMRTPGDYYDFEQEFEFQPELWMDGMSISCNTTHVAYHADIRPENRARAFEEWIMNIGSHLLPPLKIQNLMFTLEAIAISSCRNEHEQNRNCFIYVRDPIFKILDSS